MGKRKRKQKRKQKGKRQRKKSNGRSAVRAIFFFLYQQFIIRGAMAARRSYFVATYIRTNYMKRKRDEK